MQITAKPKGRRTNKVYKKMIPQHMAVVKLAYYTQRSKMFLSQLKFSLFGIAKN